MKAKYQKGGDLTDKQKYNQFVETQFNKALTKFKNPKGNLADVRGVNLKTRRTDATAESSIAAYKNGKKAPKHVGVNASYEKGFKEFTRQQRLSKGNIKPGPNEYQKGGRLTKRRDKLTGKSDALKPGWEKDRLTKKVKETQTKIDAKMNKRKFKKFGTPLNKKSINSFRQKGGVKPSLRYKPGYPTTQNSDSPHSKKKLDTAIARDSTSIANRGPIGDFFDDGTETSTSRKLQVNREYRDKVNNADSKTTAKKINTMKNKKQMGGGMERRMREAANKPMTGQETKDLGKKKLAAGRTNRRTARNMDGGAKSMIKSIAKGQRKEGRALKKTGRKMKRSDRQDKKAAEVERTSSWLKSGGEAKRLEFDAPKKMQKGGEAPKKMKKIPAGQLVSKARHAENVKDYNKKEAKTFRKESKGYNVNPYAPELMQRAGGMDKPEKYNTNPSTTKSLMQQSDVKGKVSRKHLSDIPGGGQNPDDRFATSRDNRKLKTKQKGGLKYGKGGMKNKKFLGGLAGAIGGMKGGGGLKGALKGGLGGGMLGRAIGGLKGGIAGMKGGGGLKGFLGGAGKGVMGGAFGNSNPMAQQQAQQAQGADPAMAQQAVAQQAAAQDPAMQDPAAAQMAQRGGLRKIKNALKGRRITKARSQSNKNKKKAFNNSGGDRKGNKGMRG